MDGKNGNGNTLSWVFSLQDIENTRLVLPSRIKALSNTAVRRVFNIYSLQNFMV